MSWIPLLAKYAETHLLSVDGHTPHTIYANIKKSNCKTNMKKIKSNKRVKFAQKSKTLWIQYYKKGGLGMFSGSQTFWNFFEVVFDQ